MLSNPVNQVRNTMSKGSGLLLVATDIDPVNEVDLNRWYDEEHIAERLTCPGFVRARRYKAVEGGPKYLALYDLTSLDALNTDMYKHLVGLDITHVPYRGGGPALTDLIGGRLDLMFDNLSTSLPMIQDGRLRALAVTGPNRIPALPDVPTMQEAGVKDYEAVAWMGLFVPTGTPQAIVDKLNTTVIEAQNSAALSARLAELGARPEAMSPMRFGEFVQEESKRWPGIVRATGAKAE